MSTVLKKRTRRSPFRELSKDYWEGVRQGIKLPKTIRAASIPDEHAIFKRFLPQEGSRRTSLIEVGCAPGRYLDYFAKNFGYRVAGLDYAPEACELTRRNLAMLGVEARIENADLFQYTPDGAGFDIVQSMGLIEHFTDIPAIVEKLTSMARADGGLIVTGVPNLRGHEGWVLKTVRPRIYAGHRVIELSELIDLHEQAGVTTLFADYVGGRRFPVPLRGTDFVREHPCLSLPIDLPAMLFNRLMRDIEVRRGRFPRSRRWCPSLLYIGRIG